MKAAKATVLSLVVLLGVVLAIDDAYARRGGHGGGGRGHGHWHGHGHGHGHWRGSVGFGLYLGSPWYYGWPGYYAPYYYPPAYYPSYYPRTVVVPAEAPTYVERGQTPGQEQLQPGYWYYCRDSNAYYPHVNECAGQWEQVSPRPPS